MFITYGILALIVVLYNTVSISSSSNGGRGGGAGNSGGGINIRALTGSMNFEINPEMVNVRFDDVKGLPEAKKELIEVVDFLKDPAKYSQLGARLPKVILFCFLVETFFESEFIFFSLSKGRFACGPTRMWQNIVGQISGR